MSLLDWFEHSRYVDSLEAQLRQQREDFTGQLRERDSEIRRLRGEVATRDARMNAIHVKVDPPKSIPVYDLAPDGPLDWQGELNKLVQEEENGIRSGGRIQEHEPGTDDGA